MASLYDERRKQIKLENHAARKLLINNLENFKFSDLFTFGAASVPGALKGITDQPGQAITAGDLISKILLPRGNFIRTFFKTLSILKRSFKLLLNK